MRLLRVRTEGRRDTARTTKKDAGSVTGYVCKMPPPGVQSNFCRIHVFADTRFIIDTRKFRISPDEINKSPRMSAVIPMVNIT